ncbi:MAG: mannose-1-phosphate guanylyltransferase [Bacteroidota bacterium]|nr:mannose-1-phosphate guanylyltransferase [Bacteroidota bacterium]
MSEKKNGNYYAIVMAGGVGSRFWPSSKAKNPKQFIDILGVGETLFQTTFKRLSQLIPKENIYILTNKAYVGLIKEQVPQITDEQIVPEPEMRNTAPSILLGSMKIYQKNPDAITVIAPSDHWIEDQDAFTESLKMAFSAAEKDDRLITLGIEPTYPNTGYGYIQFEKGDAAEVRKVLQFTEKPNLKKANQFLSERNYLWNAGIFIWSAKYILECFKQFAPEMYRLFEKGKDVYNTKHEKAFLEQYYKTAANISIDYAVMEKSDAIYVIPVSFKWSDLGTWSSVKDHLASDEEGNTIINSRLVAENAENNIISGYDRKIVVLKNISDLIIVEDEEVLMIVPKEDEQDIKSLREAVMKKYGDDLG